LKNSQWIVYDLGSGTFDVALVKIVAGELKVVARRLEAWLKAVDAPMPVPRATGSVQR
jgi:molecular chaperone DnaK